jgi:hypothetical protein
MVRFPRRSGADSEQDVNQSLPLAQHFDGVAPPSFRHSSTLHHVIRMLGMGDALSKQLRAGLC